MLDGHVLADHDHPLVIETAGRLAKGDDGVLDTLESLFLFVRDSISFGFPPRWSEWDRVTASRVIESGYGYCNTKATLMVALCRACGISARVHYGSIGVNVMRGIFPAFALPFLPDRGPHSWTEVEVEGAWQPIDSYINDEALFRAARVRLQESGRAIGYSLACVDGKCSCEFNFGKQGFAQMGAVVEDHGTWEDPSQFFATDRYVTFNAPQRLLYPVMAALSNRNIRKLRASWNPDQMRNRRP
jgi:hypothetical protein